MGALSTARATSFLETLNDGTRIYTATIDRVWSVFGNPHGGYLLAVILDAACHSQRARAAEEAESTTATSKRKPISHPDPGHLVASYIVGARGGPAQVHVKVLRAGLSWSNVEVKLLQRQPVGSTEATGDESTPLTLVTTTLIMFTNLSPLPTSAPRPFSTEHQYLLPNTPSVFAHRCPLLTHPARCSTDPALKSHEPARRWSTESVFWFMPDHVHWAEDLAIKQRRLRPATPDDIKCGDRPLDWGGWCEFPEQRRQQQQRPTDSTLPLTLPDTIDAPSLGFFADIFSSIPEIFGPASDGSLKDETIRPHYYPTLSLSMQFHAPLPARHSNSNSDSDSGPWQWLGAERTIGVYSSGSFIHNGRHEQLVEIWSAPSAIGAGEHVAKEQPDWRERCVPLITSTQLALSVDTAKLVKRRQQEDADKAKRLAQSQTDGKEKL